MKKALTLIFTLCLALSLAVPASAQTSSNLNNDGFVEFTGEGESTFIADASGLWRVDENGATKLNEDRASALQWADGRLYYLANEYGANEYGDYVALSQTPVSCDGYGADRRVLGEARPIGDNTVFPDEADGDCESDSYVGYRGFALCDGWLYFLGNSGEGGSYDVTAEGFGGEGETVSRHVVFKDGIALYRMKTDGSGLEKLTETLGNSVARMALADGKIYIAAGYRDMIYAYNYVNYGVYDLQGQLLTAFVNAQADERPFKSEAGSFYHITEAVLPDGDDMLVSLSDSEGDFVASQLTRLRADGSMEVIALEQDFIPSLLVGDQTYFVGSESTNIFYDDSCDYEGTFGVYVKSIDAAGGGEKLVALPYNDYMLGFALNFAGGALYFRGSDGVVYRLNDDGLAKFGADGFAASEIDFVSSWDN